jgi:A/G-specific adenine glycosylase
MQKLPGLGRYTANAVATFAFDQSVPIVEANTARLFARLSNLQLRIDSGAGRDALWQFAAFLVPVRNAAAFNSALMDLGAMICIAGEPKCGECPVRRFCRAVNPATLPLKQPRALLTKLHEPHQFVRRSDRVLLEQSSERWRGMWILPRLAQPNADARLLHRSHFPFTHHRVTLEVFDASTFPPHHHTDGLISISSIRSPCPRRTDARCNQSCARIQSQRSPLDFAPIERDKYCHNALNDRLRPWRSRPRRREIQRRAELREPEAERHRHQPAARVRRA